MNNGFLQDHTGNNSSMRLMLVFIVVCVMTAWMLVCWKSGTLTDIPTGVLGLVGTIIAGTVGNKALEVTKLPTTGGENVSTPPAN